MGVTKVASLRDFIIKTNTSMRKLLLMLLSGFAWNALFAQGIPFEPATTTWAELLAKAQQSNQLIFVAAYSMSCHNCQQMIEKVYPNDSVGLVFKDKYINAKIDVDNGEGISIAMQYGIRSYPSYLFINGQGELLHRAMGTMTTEKIMELGQNAINPAEQFYVLRNRFAQGDSSKAVLKKLTFMAKNLAEFSLLDSVHIAYLNTEKDWLTKDNMEIILAGVKTMEQKTFTFLVQNQKAFIQAYDTVKINNTIDEIVLNGLSMVSYDYNQGIFDLDKARNYGSKYLPNDLFEKSMSIFTVNQHLRKHETELFLNSVVKHFDQYPCYNGFLYNNLALSVYECTTNPFYLEKAASWALKAIALKDNYSFNDTAAALYFKLGNKAKAKEYALKALEKAKISGENTVETDNLLKKIEGL
jgi:Thioredoxin-like